MTLEEAKAILQLFGPCTQLYECMTAEEVVEDAAKFATAKEYVEMRLRIEDVLCDRMNEAAYEREAGAGLGSHAQTIAENKAFMRELRERLAGARLL